MNRVHLTDDDRLRMFRKAGEAERSNRPRALVLGGAVLLAVSLVFAFMSWSARADAVRTLRGVQASDASLEQTLDEIVSLRETPDVGFFDGPYTPLPAPQTELERQATRAGLERPTPPRVDAQQVSDSISRRFFRYTGVASPTAESLLRWLDNVERGIVGMEVESINLQPATRGRGAGQHRTGWTMDVTFSRLETSS